MNQQIRFCKSFDGTRLAYAMTGAGPPLVSIDDPSAAAPQTDVGYGRSRL